jgi:hypothetical protein
MPRAAVVGVAGLVALACLGACSGRASFSRGQSFADVERVVRRADLEICSTSRHPTGLANQATASRVYRIARSCPSDDVVRLVVDRFADATARDGAARQFEVLGRPRADGVVWTWGPFTLFAAVEHDDAVMNRLTDALDAAGAR